jgi:hypothetical protein
MNDSLGPVLAYRKMASHKPDSRTALAAFIRNYFHLHLPDRALCPHHCSPLDYLCASFFDDDPARGDLVLWAPRGGGKTQLAAAATLLDLLFKPGIQIRILGGSLEQSEKMYAYLRRLLTQDFAPLVAGAATQRRLELTNGSGVQVLAQSENAVRGQRVQVLRCDEVELFDPAIWQAAQLTTRSLPASKDCGPIRGRIEAISTYHVPGGIMESLLEAAAAPPPPASTDPAAIATAPARRLCAWCLWDVIARCPPQRSCETCALAPDCQGRARNAMGFLSVPDALALQARVSRRTWETEMLCRRPKPQHAVFAGFDPSRHVRAEFPDPANTTWIAGVDFGLRTFVWLFLRVVEGRAPRLHVAAEYVAADRTLGQNLAQVAAQARTLTGYDTSSLDVTSPALASLAATGGRASPSALAPGIHSVFCDPAGNQVNAHSGTSDLALLRRAGWNARFRCAPIAAGLGLLEQLLDPADSSPPRLSIDPACPRLIAALTNYRRDPISGEPIKDGTHDHLIDALRYATVGYLGISQPSKWRRY